MANPNISPPPSIKPKQGPESFENKPEATNISHKIQEKSAQVIQRWWMCIEQRQTQKIAKELIPSSLKMKHTRKMDFEALSAALNEEHLISSTDQLLQFIENKTSKLLPKLPPLPEVAFPPKAFLAAYMILNHSETDPNEQIFEKKGGEEVQLQEHAYTLLRSFESLQKTLSTASEKDFRKELKKSLFSFHECRRTYQEAFSVWNKSHSKLLVTELIDMYLRIEMRKKHIKQRPENMQREFYTQFSFQQESLIKKIIDLGGESAQRHLKGLLTQMDEDWERQKWSVLSEHEVLHELALNPQMEFTFNPGGEKSKRVADEVKKALSEGSQGTPRIRLLLFDFREKVCGLMSEKPSILAEMHEKLSPEKIEEYSQNITNPKTFEQLFGSLFACILKWEAPEHNRETKRVIQQTLGFLQMQDSAIPVLPESFAYLFDKLEQIKTDLKNFYRHTHVAEHRRNAIAKEREFFQKKLDLFEINLDLLEKQIQSILKHSEKFSLTPNQLYSPHTPAHFLITILLEKLFSSEEIALSNCPETLLLDLEKLEGFRKDLIHSMHSCVSLLSFKEIMTSHGHGNDLASATCELKSLLAPSISRTDQETAFLTAQHIKTCLKERKKKLDLPSVEKISSSIESRLQESSPLFQLIKKKTSQAIKASLYKGSIAPQILQSQELSLFHDNLSKLGKALAKIMHFNLEVHKERYQKLIESHQFEALFQSLRKVQKTLPLESLPIVLKGRLPTFKDIYDKIQKLALTAHVLTLIKKQVWHSSDWVEGNSLSNEELQALIRKHNLCELLQDPQTSPKSIGFKAKEILKEVLEEKEVQLPAEDLKQFDQLIDRSINFSNPGYRMFHADIADALQTFFKRGKLPASLNKGLLHFFEPQIQDIAQVIGKTVEEAKQEAMEEEDIGPVPLQPENMRAGRF